MVELRAATTADHRRLDQVIGRKGICSREDGYRDFLTRFRSGVSRTIENIDWDWAESKGLPEGPRRRARYQLLDRDLEELGVEFGGGFLDASRDGKGPACGVGVLYVLEGSAHGAQVLLADVRRAGLGHLPTRFLSESGADLGPSWSGFVGWLRSLDADPDFVGKACDGACAAFRQFHEQWSLAPRP